MGSFYSIRKRHDHRLQNFLSHLLSICKPLPHLLFCFVVMGDAARRQKKSGALSRFMSIGGAAKSLMKNMNRKHAACIAHATHHRISLFIMDKFSGLPISYSTLLRSAPGSFWDFPAPRIRAAVAGRPPYHWVPRFWPPRITRSASARWWAQDATHLCQRSLCFTLSWAKRCELYEILPPIASSAPAKMKLGDWWIGGLEDCPRGIRGRAV